MALCGEGLVLSQIDPLVIDMTQSLPYLKWLIVSILVLTNGEIVPPQLTI